jgi:hypothetical protein
MKNLMIALFSVLVCSCNNKPNEKQKSSSPNDLNGFFVINYEDAVQSKKTVKLSQLAYDVEYVQLETNKDCMVDLRYFPKYFFTDDYIFVSNRDHILKFSREGKFIKKIGSPGRGPGEIDLIRTMSIIPDKNLIVVQKNSARELLFFSFEGELIKTVGYLAYFTNIKVMNDENYIAYNEGNEGNEKFTFLVTNENKDTLSFVNNYTTWVKTSRATVSLMSREFEAFHLFHNRYFFKARYNDTVYTIENNKIRPVYFVNLGKYKLPDELRLERINQVSPEKMEEYYKIARNCYSAEVIEVINRVFLGTYSFSKMISKYVLFDKVSLKGDLLINEEGNSTGIVNDWDGGSDFWPAGCVTDNQVFMPINIIDLQKKFTKEIQNQKSVKFPEKQKELEKISQSDVMSNPVIMIVKLIPFDITSLIGKWIFNRSKSTFQSVTIDSTIIFHFDPRSSLLTMNFTTFQDDNKPLTHSKRCIVGGGMSAFRSRSRGEVTDCHWDPGKQTLLVTESIIELKNEKRTKSILTSTLYSLIDNGKTLVIKNGETLDKRHNILVYDKTN